MDRDPDDDGPERDDRALLAAHVAGDTTAFGLLFARHRDRLWAVALRTTGDPEDAADALQDAMVAAFRRAGSYRGDAAVTTWLHRIVVNACLDRLRRRKVRLADPLPEDLDGSLSRPGDPGAGVPSGGHGVEDPADAAERTDQRDCVLAALRTLPADQRAALVLVDMEGYSVHEAAAILGVPGGTVKSRCSRGRARLAPLLRSLGPPPRPASGNPWDPSRVPSPGPSSTRSDPRDQTRPAQTDGGERP